jgi:hypothetical protein
MELRSVFPSSTAPALTSLATGMWPAEHALTGWHVYLPQQQRQITALPFVERFTGLQARDAGISSEAMFVEPSMARAFTRDTQYYLPRRIADSVYSRYVYGGKASQPYDKLYQGIDAVVARVRSARAATYTYLYHPSIDTAEHEHGPGSWRTTVEVTRLEQALERADGVIIEGRDRVYELRGSNVKHQGLAEALADVAAELTPIAPTSFSVSVVGEPRPLHPVVREEAYRIGAEALRNAFQHAAAAHIDLEIEYTRQGLSVRIVDDGRGFDVATLADNSRHKHFGLAGLRERAQKIRSELEVSSKPGLGTEVALHVPGVVAYAPERPTKAVDG